MNFASRGRGMLLVGVCLLGLLLASCSSDKLDTFGACHSFTGAVRVYAATGEQQYARIAVIIDVTVSAPIVSYDLSEPNRVIIAAQYTTHSDARNDMCIDVSSSAGGKGIRSDVIAGYITAETRFEGPGGIPSEIRLTATGLEFANGEKVGKITTGWLEIGFSY